MEDDEQPGRPVATKTDENVGKVRTLVRTVAYGQRKGETNFNNTSERKKYVPKRSQRIRQSLAIKQTPTSEHAPYSSGLVPCDFSLFPKLKS
jgi:hypothetical protein